MPRCNLCNKETTEREPMVLAGNKCFIQSAGNGRAWVGQPPSVRYWKTFALLEVSICPDCKEKEAGKFFSKMFKKDPLQAVLKKYQKDKKIPKEAILALPGQLQTEHQKDLIIKETMMIADPWLGPQFMYQYELNLYRMSDIEKIGTVPVSLISGDAWNYAPAQGVEEARQTAIDLFNHLKNK